MSDEQKKHLEELIGKKKEGYTGNHWFEKHLNWIAVISFISLYPLGYALGTLVRSISPYMSTGVYYSIVYICAALWIFGIDGWVLKKKSRSLWNLLWLIVPFGWIVFLCLENKTDTISAMTLPEQFQKEIDHE